MEKLRFSYLPNRAGVGNLSLACDVSSSVDVIFVIDPPIGGGDVGDFDFVSGMDGGDVVAYIRRSLLELFDIVYSDGYGLIFSIGCSGGMGEVGEIYLSPWMVSSGVEDVH